LLVVSPRLVGRVLRGLVAAPVLLALVAGLPWALWHFAGWPLPHHVPTWAEVQAALLGPMTTGFLLDLLACLCWITWAAFTVDVLRCTIDLARSGVDAVRLADFSGGPLRKLTGVLIGTILLSFLGNRPAPASVSSPAAALGTRTQVVATAPAWQHPAPSRDAPVRNVALASQNSAIDPAVANAPARPASVVVLAPQNGVYDSLSRIAERTLGDAARWPEIFDANKGKPQPYGHFFTNPNLIYPGEELVLPADAPTPELPPREPPTPPAPPIASSSSTSPPREQPSTPVTAAPTRQTPPNTTSTSPQPGTTREPGFSRGSEMFVGLGLAASVSAALAIARRRYRAKYRPGSGDRDDLPVAPVVYQLRRAHIRTHDEADFNGEDGCSQRFPSLPALVVGEPATSSGQQPSVSPELGVRDGREIALNLAVTRGLGLIGAGAPAAARALLLVTLTQRSPRTAQPAGTFVVVPADDLAVVLGGASIQSHMPSALRVVDDLDAALDAVEAETLVRAAAHHDQTYESQTWSSLTLVARPPEHHQRLQAVLDNGAPFGVTGLLLGQWQPGVTCYVREDGTISATSPGLGEPLRGTRMFHLGTDDAAELLSLLRQAESTPSTADNSAPHDSALLDPCLADRSDNDDKRLSDTDQEVPAVVQPAASDLEITASQPPADPGAHPDSAAVTTRQRPVQPQPSHAKAGLETIGERIPVPARPTPALTTTERGSDTTHPQISITVLGALRVRWHPDLTTDEEQAREITAALQPRTKELLVLLALHPGGTTRDTLVSALWGDEPPARPTNALHTALSRMRRDLTTATGGAVTDIAPVNNGHYGLDRAIVSVDYWRFQQAVAARRAASTEQERIDAYREVVNSYGGPLAEGMSTIEWIEPVREATRRDAIDAVAALARALVKEDPQQTLDLLETAREFDPYNEALYRDIMRLQERLGQYDAIPRTLSLLTTRVAEINESPSDQAVALASGLRRRQMSPGTPVRRSDQGAARQG
jgi:DNA-binding SARP family transcriptional activator